MLVIENQIRKCMTLCAHCYPHSLLKIRSLFLKIAYENVNSVDRAQYCANDRELFTKIVGENLSNDFERFELSRKINQSNCTLLSLGYCTNI